MVSAASSVPRSQHQANQGKDRRDRNSIIEVLSVTNEHDGSVEIC